MKTLCLILTVVLISGCATTGLPHRPAVNPTKVPISASHQVMSDRFYVEVASGGFRVESVDLVRADGTEMSADTIHRPALGRASSGSGGLSVGIGIGGAAGRNNAVGGGVGIGSGPTEVQGNTIVIFPASKVGPGPWRLRVKLVSFAAVDIDLPALVTADE
jgi:hypothetical protein